MHIFIYLQCVHVLFCCHVHVHTSRFAEEDMTKNILFDEQQEGKFKSSNEAPIKACTIYKLIERLTYHEHAGEFHCTDQ